MPSSPDFVAHILELLNPLGVPRVRRMFGGHGFYIDDLFVGILAGDTLFLKADDQSRARFEAAGSHSFSYTVKGEHKAVLGFWSAPEEALESPVLMQPWARMALEAALKARNAKPVAKKKPASKTKKALLR